ncbi:D-galacturonic acid reductase-like protein [Aulographum hederae CBS 113979]|uniref:D-galacturonic acid reductase-like protein n=1 Tax=Aulographum hederae CBS 113979 TaxID=1176131 RepID=A0A6G1GWL1_9PEZI|nr:D-galacturonic acid reductase-like protein [Aulographum hederae CBS 113979]
MAPLNVLMVGTGEYTTGWVGTGGSTSDKKVGVVGLTLFDLRKRGKVGDLSMVGVSGHKYPAIRNHLDKNITQAYNGLDTSFKSYPDDNTSDPEAYKTAIDALQAGDAITIFTPDPTHFPIALYAIERGIHVLITKPAVKTLEEHQILMKAAKEKNVFVYIEHHKRYDPTYADARHKARTLGDFNYFNSYMSQPKSQLETFKAWAGKDSDISYYLNSHHVDICESMVAPLGYYPIKVTASAATGIATSLGCVPETEDTITLLVDWEKKTDDGSTKIATGVYTASWTAPQKAGVHSNQYFHYMAGKGEVRINQAKRGYDVTSDDAGLMWYNPFYMQYSPDENGDFAGQSGYGYVSFEKFVNSVTDLKEGKVTLEELDARPLPTLKNTIGTGAILEAGRRSLDEKRSIEIVNEGGVWTLK